MLPFLGSADPVCLCRWYSNCHLKKGRVVAVPPPSRSFAKHHANEVLPRPARRTRDHGLSIKNTTISGHISTLRISPFRVSRFLPARINISSSFSLFTSFFSAFIYPNFSLFARFIRKQDDSLFGFASIMIFRRKNLWLQVNKILLWESISNCKNSFIKVSKNLTIIDRFKNNFIWTIKIIMRDTRTINCKIVKTFGNIVINT